jgi:hypothetical protein
MRREERHHSASHNVRVKIATSRNVRTLREMSPRRIMNLNICYAPTSKTRNSRIARLKTRQPRILFSLLSALINHACFRGWRVKTSQPRSIANLILLAALMHYILWEYWKRSSYFLSDMNYMVAGGIIGQSQLSGIDAISAKLPIEISGKRWKLIEKSVGMSN